MWKGVFNIEYHFVFNILNVYLLQHTTIVVKLFWKDCEDTTEDCQTLSHATVKSLAHFNWSLGESCCDVLFTVMHNG